MTGSDDVFDLDKTYVILDDGPAAVPIEVDDEFWAKISERTEFVNGRLMCLVPMSKDWPTWEMHPEGDEILYLLSGAVDIVLDDQGEEHIFKLRSRTACIIPRGVWHRGIVHEPGELLAITRGSGTLHRAVEESAGE